MFCWRSNLRRVHYTKLMTALRQYSLAFCGGAMVREEHGVWWRWVTWMLLPRTWQMYGALWRPVTHRPPNS
ncbi:hypothetical protein FMEAI12_2900015 [Parafrankia sp. Ea1.12]|nr:hypothetical protein FMEAI12_2900015 [Parafrankia sp. Ea1.12]